MKKRKDHQNHRLEEKRQRFIKITNIENEKTKHDQNHQ
jgi:hypothetical protein